jgi:hypothetical protein
VSKAIEKAATASWPAARYVMPFSTALGLFFSRFMPTPVLDLVMRWALGLNAKLLATKPARASVRPPRLLPADASAA